MPDDYILGIKQGLALKFFRWTELAGSDAPKVGTRCVSGWGTRIWIQISETPLTYLDIAEMRSNGFALKYGIHIFIPYS
ncbi:hypothetical protein TNCV_4007671 [Trichonephila clavipes]|nr:hypothetical protein TNCV_4007671 [Trichonephila clavipes]